MKKIIEDIFNTWNEDIDFSGVFSASDAGGVLFQYAAGHRNRAEELLNTVDTAFGIASGTKLFTGLAVCKLIDEGKLSLESKLWDVLPGRDLGRIDKGVTIHQLLTHTSGVGDYIDEEAEDADAQLEALYHNYPCYLWTQMDYYLQMIAPLPPKFEPGARYAYSNAGFVLLGLVVEAVSGMPYQQYMRENVITKVGEHSSPLRHTGFYRMDSLPANTALGYMEDEDSGEWRTNIFSLPIIGGSDGGIYTCAADMDKLWRAIVANRILSQAMTQTLLSRQVVIDEEDGESYGLGVYLYEDDGKLAYFAVGGDTGVGFCTAYYPKTGVAMSCFSNTGWMGFYDLIGEMLEVLG